jgi:PBP1b-binding outer membrane lipoprotein LpoB
MKKAATILILLLISAFMLTGCAKCIDKKEESVKVKIVNEYYKPKETRLIGIINHVP